MVDYEMKQKHTNPGDKNRSILFAQGLQRIEQLVRDRSGGKTSAHTAGRLKAARTARSVASRRIPVGLGTFLLAGLVASAQAAEIKSPTKTIEGTRMVTSVAFSHDGRRIASGGWDNKVQLWAVGAQAKVGEIDLSGSGDLLLDLAFSPDGRSIVTGSRQDSKVDPTVKFWDARTGDEVSTLQGAPPEFCDSVAFSPDGKLIAAGCFNQARAVRTIHLWDARTGGYIKKETIKGFNGPVAFSPDSKSVIGGRQELKLFNTDTREALWTIDGKGSKGINSAAFSPADKNLIVTGNGDGTIKLWDASTGAAMVTFEEKHGARVLSVAFGRKGTRIVSSSEDKTVKLWDAENGKVLWTSELQPGQVDAVAFSPDGKSIASGGQDGVKFWKVE